MSLHIMSQLLQNFSSAELFHSHSCFITIYHQKMHYYFPATGDIPAAGADYSSSMEFTVFQLKFQQAGSWVISSRQVCTLVLPGIQSASKGGKQVHCHDWRKLVSNSTLLQQQGSSSEDAIIS